MRYILIGAALFSMIASQAIADQPVAPFGYVASAAPNFGASGWTYNPYGIVYRTADTPAAISGINTSLGYDGSPANSVYSAFAETGLDYFKTSAGCAVSLCGSSAFSTREFDVTASSTTSGNLNAYVSVNTRIVDPFSSEQRGAQAWSGYTPGPFGGNAVPIYMQAEGTFALSITDITTLSLPQNLFMAADAYEYFQVQVDFTTEYDDYGRPYYVYGNPYLYSYVENTNPFNRNVTKAVSFIGGHSYRIEIGLSCLTAISNLGQEAVSANCDAAHSGYWNGLTNLSDPNFTLLDASGHNYVYSSTQSPFPLVVNSAGGVVEPGTWSLLITGFGLVGEAMRRRRVVAA